MLTPTTSARRRRAITLGVSALTLGICVATPVVARTGDGLREGVRNGTATKETQIISGVRGTSFYGTRQSNVSTGSGAGGAAIYGCRRPTRECTRHVNLEAGPAAAFVTDGAIPFTVSGSGLVTNLNADKLDGQDADQIVTTARAGKTASATTADTAARASTVDTLTPAGKMVFSSPTASNADPNVARATASEVALFTRAPFTVYGKCFVDTTANAVLAEVYARTTQSGSVLDGQTDNLDGNTAFLDAGTAEDLRQVDSIPAALNAASIELDEDLTSLMAPDGAILQFQAQLVSKHGTPPAGDGPYGAGDRCGFSITVVG